MKKKNSFKKNNGFNNNKFKILLQVLGAVAILGFISLIYYNNKNNISIITEKQLVEMLHQGEIKRVVLMKNDNYVKIQLTSKAFYHKKYNQESEDLKDLEENNIHYILKTLSPKVFHETWKDIQANLKAEQRLDYDINDSISLLRELINNFGSLLFLLFILWMLGAGALRGKNNIFNIGNSKETYFDKDNNVNVTFNDIKGIPEAKHEVKEIVDFLKHPKKYTRLGGRMPKGILLVGPPGCGKTLLAKAVAGEAGVPFFSLSGSDFVEMFVGVGASRVRNLFEKAKKEAPCIIFIDEIDAVGRARSKHNLSSNEEGEHTLNALLSAMDGFDSNTNIMVFAATNRVDVLDDALLRPGRFDRQIDVDIPTIKGREEIFKLYLKTPRKVSKKVSIKELAKRTPGFSGADIDNVVNTGALIAAAQGKKTIDMDVFEEAIERINYGLEKKHKLIDEKEKKIVAYHEAGHAVASCFLKHAASLSKLSIIPRGTAALGYALYLPKERLISQYQDMLDRMCTLLGGRAAEMIFFDALSTGAQNDLEVATNLAYHMHAVYGMSKEVGPVSFPPHKYQGTFNKPYSEATGKIIDTTVRTLIQEQYQRALALLQDKKTIVEAVAEKLLEKEVLYPEEIKQLIAQQTPTKDIGKPSTQDVEQPSE